MTLPAYLTDAGFKAFLNSSYPVPDTALTASGATALRERVMVTAYNQLFTLYAIGDASEENRQHAVYAQGLFIYREGEALQKRAGLRAQGVTEAGIVKEKYKDLNGIPVCPEADALLSPYALAASVTLVQRERDVYTDDLL
jgi:hypothetical protein